MNPAYGRAMGPAAPPSDYGDDDAAPIGTRLSGYAGPESGPFECGNCIHFEDEGSTCKHPAVIGDPEIEKNENGLAIVEAEGCCNFFRPSPQKKGTGETRSAGSGQAPALQEENAPGGRDIQAKSAAG